MNTEWQGGMTNGENASREGNVEFTLKQLYVDRLPMMMMVNGFVVVVCSCLMSRYAVRNQKRLYLCRFTSTPISVSKFVY
ncbi:hypothetical protein M378DRAFT_864936 [Amanita muscaria Koide BX008]|uniref:Uncharacterized protein n=1 Tax=Amanita muscaria (strain Koide BX008) TaxID=946122 RepID=A0A0C2WIB1_AMAMK|nr:hypothetical protein M378DRAFT_864936 [Amanita muscaria Koide BX008]